MHALVTGASSGIGAAIAVALGSRGHRVTLAARREDRLRALASDMDATGSGATAFVRPADLSDLSECAALVDDARRELGPIHLLVNNAGVQIVAPTPTITDERAEHLLTVDLTAALRLQRLVLEDMLPHDHGTIVNIASLAAIVPTPGMMHYNAAKSALAAASESLRAELSHTNVNVLTVYPGPVATDMEAAAVAAYGNAAAARWLPRGTPAGLARRILRAVELKRPRVVYPFAYEVTRWLRPFATRITEAATPQPAP